MKTIWVQFNKLENEDVYKLDTFTNVKIEKAVFVEITQEIIDELQEMLNN